MDANTYDVVICGSGSAGLAAATWLSRYGIRCKILDKRTEAMRNGQADGVQCRMVEVFESFGLADELLRLGQHIVEVTFWTGDGKTMRRNKRTADTQPGLSHQPHIVLNQAVVNKLLIDSMCQTSGLRVDYGYEVQDVLVDPDRVEDHTAPCVTVTALKDGRQETFQARYVLGCDGAHSAVRHALGFKMVGDSTNAVWGVMDVYPRTNFPDIRKKAMLHGPHGSVMIIPREGGALVRFYIELAAGTIAQEVTIEQLQAEAEKRFAPYALEIAETYWWSAYSIGQRLADHFHQDYRVFLTGDACHTHSPKAGQGMNVSLQDGHNIGWKLGSVLTNQAHPDLLQTYVSERAATAADLIEFDRKWTSLFARMRDPRDVSPDHFSEQFVKHGRYTAGITARYDESTITAYSQPATTLATRLVVGMRMPSTQIVRFCDAKPLQLAKILPADGRWRVLIFIGDINQPAKAESLAKLGQILHGYVTSLAASTPYIDSFIDPVVILAGPRAAVEQEQIPDFFWPPTGRWGIRDLQKVFNDEQSYNSGHGHAYDFYGIDPKRGAIVIVRPDQYLSRIIALDEGREVASFFDGFVRRQ